MNASKEPRCKARLFLFALLFALTLHADEVVDSRKLYQEALAAQKANDAATFVKKLRAASDLRPQHPTLLYQLAAALDANGQREEAARILDRVAAMGFTYDAAKDFPDPRYSSVAKRFAANAKPIGTAKREFTIDRLGLIPEGMAWDGKRFFVSSVRTKTIFVRDEPFATAPYGVFGMAADAKRGVLWAATSALPQVEGFTEAEKGKAALLRIDLRRGRVLETYPLAGEHHFGDVAVAPDGEVYVSDSNSPVIYRLRGEALEPFVTGPFLSMQGLAVVGHTIYAADYAKGLFAIDRRTGDIHALRVPPNASLLGVDGIYAVDARTLVGTQNGTSPFRIIRIRLAPGGLSVMSVETLLANAPGMGDPTLGVVANNRFYFNANAQWDLFTEDGKISDPLRLSEAVVLSIPLR